MGVGTTVGVGEDGEGGVNFITPNTPAIMAASIPANALIQAAFTLASIGSFALTGLLLIFIALS